MRETCSAIRPTRKQSPDPKALIRSSAHSLRALPPAVGFAHSIRASDPPIRPPLSDHPLRLSASLICCVHRLSASRPRYKPIRSAHSLHASAPLIRPAHLPRAIRSASAPLIRTAHQLRSTTRPAHLRRQFARLIRSTHSRHQPAPPTHPLRASAPRYPLSICSAHSLAIPLLSPARSGHPPALSIHLVHAPTLPPRNVHQCPSTLYA